MLTITTIGLTLAFVVACSAWFRARSLARRLERLTESYWELRYDNGQLKARLTRLEVTAGVREPDAAPEAPRASPTTFVPLSSLKK